jgi:hypothetical protein
LRDQFLVDARSLSKVSGHPFRIAEIEAAIGEIVAKSHNNGAVERDIRDSKAGTQP